MADSVYEKTPAFFRCACVEAFFEAGNGDDLVGLQSAAFNEDELEAELDALLAV
ncbi:MULTISPECIES: hypothetical protein [Kribbella]|jgi:hypothetical protein|uniref:Uncharacterized protein n=1 Tax=Kribbella koreensis TaxID=57909 RepID=A0ABN1RD16_9ACTN